MIGSRKGSIGHGSFVFVCLCVCIGPHNLIHREVFFSYVYFIE
jgi:hypothetical protein